MQNNSIAIVPITNELLHDAIKLVNNVFHKQGKEPASIMFRASLEKQPYKLLARVFAKIDFSKYWVAVKNTQVIGVTGIYTYKYDHDSVWGGWTCIDPRCIGSFTKAGGLLFKTAFDEAKKTGRTYFQLYTTDAPEEIVANKIYDRIGFVIVNEKRCRKTGNVKKIMKLRMSDVDRRSHNI